MARTRADNKLCRVLLYQLFDADLIIPKDMNRSSFKDKVLIDIPSERVVVVDQNEIRRSSHWW